MKPFYRYLMTYRHEITQSEKSMFAEHVFLDSSFPKHSSDYHEISSYLEMNASYMLDMSLFDEVWHHYTEVVLR